MDEESVREKLLSTYFRAKTRVPNVNQKVELRTTQTKSMNGDVKGGVKKVPVSLDDLTQTVNNAGFNQDNTLHSGGPTPEPWQLVH